jgi:hypothetical protein
MATPGELPGTYQATEPSNFCQANSVTTAGHRRVPACRAEKDQLERAGLSVLKKIVVTARAAC